MELLRQRDAWTLGMARHPMFSGTKWLPATMLGTLSARRVRLMLGFAGTRPPLQVQFRRADRIVMAASMLWTAALVEAVVL